MDCSYHVSRAKNVPASTPVRVPLRDNILDTYCRCFALANITANSPLCAITCTLPGPTQSMAIHDKGECKKKVLNSSFEITDQLGIRS